MQFEITTNPTSIKGLAFYESNLIGHHSFVVTRFYLNESIDSALRQEIIAFQLSNSSTAGEVGKDGITNGQFTDQIGVYYLIKHISIG